MSNDLTKTTLLTHTYVRFACHIEHLLGATGTRLAMRLFAFVLFCMGV
jgi:small neutral amino acid transporter SnatA (MarC family)